MTTIDVTIEHPGDHEPNGETFADDFRDGITKALREQQLKRGEGEPTIVGYTQTSGVSTVYKVELDTEPSAAAKRGKAASKADADETKADVAPDDDDDAPGAGDTEV